MEEAANQQAPCASLDYRARWEARGSVVTRPRKEIDFSLHGDFFPAEKQPLLLTANGQTLDAKERHLVLVKSFFKYLHDIVNLEIDAIVSACHKVIYKAQPVVFPESLKLNAYTVIMDEYYHVYLARDMMVQLRSKFPELEDVVFPESDSSQALKAAQSRLDPAHRDIFEILAVCIFETTLVRELVEFFNTPGIHPSIRYYVNDHMNDESRHYGFFLDLMKFIWSGLPQSYRSALGTELPRFIQEYLRVNSDMAFNRQLLAEKTDQKTAASAIAGVYHGFEITPDLPMVKNVLNALRKAGIANSPEVVQGFSALGWNI